MARKRLYVNDSIGAIWCASRNGTAGILNFEIFSYINFNNIDLVQEKLLKYAFFIKIKHRLERFWQI